MATVEVFKLNGLLSTMDVEYESGELNSTTFLPLATSEGGLSCGTSKSTQETAGPLDNSFRPNGLLGGFGKDITGFEDDTPLSASAHTSSQVVSSQSQEEILPDIVDLLQPYSKRSTRSSITCHISLSSISASTYEGRPVYLKKKIKSTRVRTELDNRSTMTLLEVPVHKLMDRLSETVAATLVNSERPTSPSTSGTAVEDELWVDRYRPQRFTELLGDERVHRETMSWLKEWDRCIFGKRKAHGKSKITPQEGESDYNYEDEYHRPKEKILLLSGPPGLGKTTLAHVVARQAGYDVMEVNASDARSGQIVDDRIRPALEAGSAIGSTKPICVIVDEIDGATGGTDNTSGFVQKLIQLTFDKPKKKSRSSEKRDPKGKRPLLRPLICICNDLYAPSLTKLRQHTRIIRFTRPADIHLVKRLREVCENEGLRADSRALTTLVGIAKGDMRGCLNTLQFVKARNQEVTEAIIRTATSGMKEMDASFSSVLNSLFAPLPKKRVRELGLCEEEETKYVERLSRDIDASGSPDKIAWGCFEHYANLRQFDASFERYESANNWLLTYDVFSGTMRSEQNYAIMPYLSYALVPFYPLFQERGGGRVERPKADWENLMRTRANEEIYRSFSRCTRSASGRRSAGLRHLLANNIVQLEFAPFINRIISPPLRPVNSQIIKPEERVLLARLVEIMVSLELRFVQEKTEDGQLVYRLDPPIDVFVTYDGKRASDIAISRYATRHLVAAEIDAKLIALQAEAMDKGKTKPSNFFQGHKPSGDVDEDDPNEDTESKEAAGDLGATLLQAKPVAMKRKSDAAIDPVEKPPVDFFGRLITTQSNVTSQHPKEPVLKKFRVSYRFKEGNSAAVRKPVKVNAFL